MNALRAPALEGLARTFGRWRARRRVALHLLTAGGVPRAWQGPIAHGVREAYVHAAARLPLGAVDVVVQAQPALALPSTGLGGYTPTANLVFVFVDVAHDRIATSLRDELVPIVAHELMHAARWHGPGYGATLGEALVSEGLALHFEQGLRGTVPWYATGGHPALLAALEEEARAQWHAPDYDRLAWFSPQRDARGLAFRGYVLGHHLVGRRLAAWRQDAAAAFDRPAAAF